jgi:hypothetical protein
MPFWFVIRIWSESRITRCVAGSIQNVFGDICTCSFSGAWYCAWTTRHVTAVPFTFTFESPSSRAASRPSVGVR